MSALAERDAEILTATRRGETETEIAERLGVTISVVRNVRKLAKKLATAVVPLNGEIMPAADAPRATWARMISAAWQKSVDAIFETGRLIAAAKAALPHGDFLGMIDSDLPFGPRTAQRLMRVAGDERLSNATHASLLPPRWDTLYELTKLDDATLAARFADGTIRPDMERREIAAVRKRQAREVNHSLLAHEIALLPEKRFAIAVEDFEWDYEVRSRVSGMDRHAANHYPTAETAHTAEEIVARTEARMRCLADDCLLGMWVTVPHLQIGLDVLRLRGFRYVSSAVWIKHLPGQAGLAGIGMGHWFRVDHELFVLGVRGNRIFAPLKGENWRSVFTEPPSGVHSEKTEEPLRMLENLFPDLPKVELNRRGPPRPGWDAWGNEVEDDDGTESLRGGAAAARLAHNQKVDGANPSPATSSAAGGAEVSAAPRRGGDDAGPIPAFLKRDRAAA